jgi:hypothetical protein
MIRIIVFDFHGTLSLRSGKVNRLFSLLFEKKLEQKEKNEEKEQKSFTPPTPETPDYIAINDLKNVLKKYKKDSWYDAMKESKIDAKVMMPTLDDIITFISYMQNLNPEIIFSVASMVEEEMFIYDLLRYCFTEKGIISPFTLKNIVSYASLKETDVKSQNSSDKTPHIEVILKRNGLRVEKKEIVIIDDNELTVAYMASQHYCAILATDYFTIADWNRGCHKD